MPESIIDVIRAQVAADIRLSQEGDRIRIGVPLYYDDGDSCGFYVEGTPDGELLLTDMGDVLMRAGYHDANLLSDGYRSRVEHALDFFGIAERDGSMTMPVEMSGLGDGVFSFAQASLELVKIAQLPKDRKKKKIERKFRDTLSKIIMDSVPEGQLISNWHDDDIDPDRVYPVDFLVKANNRTDWYIFGVGTQNKCLHAALSCHKYRSISRRFNGLVIYRDKSNLPSNATKPLDDVIERYIESIGDEHEIKSFIQHDILGTPR